MRIQAPEFPSEHAFKFGFDVYAQAYNGIDWICDGFNFAVALATVSHALGRKYVINEQGKHYPNFYQCILGRSHLAAKSPTLDRAVAGIDYIRRNVDPLEMFRIIGDVNSAEGFRAEFATHRDGDENDPELWYSDGNGVRGFLPIDEFGSLLAKSRQSSTEGISVQLTRFYNPSAIPMENNTRKDKTFGQDWVVNVLAASTMEWYERFITTGDYSSGFLNRFVFYLHEQVEIKKARFDPVDVAALGQWQNMTQGMARDSLDHRTPRVFTLSSEAFEAYEAWYLPLIQKLVEGDDIQIEAAARVSSHTLKLCLVYSVMNGEQGEVSLGCFESAKAVGDYWAKCSGLTVDAIDFDQRSKAERMVFEAVGRVMDKHGSCSKRLLRQAINTKSMSSEEMNKALESLVNADVLGYESDGQSNTIWVI